MAPRGRPKKEQTKLIENVVKSEKYQRFFIDEDGHFFIPSKIEFSCVDNIFDEIMQEPCLASIHLTPGAIYMVLSRATKSIKKHFEDLMRKRLKTVKKLGALGRPKEAEQVAILIPIICKYAHILDGKLPDRASHVYTEMINEPEMLTCKKKITEDQIYLMVQKHEKFLRNEITNSRHEQAENQHDGLDDNNNKVHHKTSSDDNPDGEDSDDSTGRILNAEDLPHLESRSAILEIPPSALPPPDAESTRIGKQITDGTNDGEDSDADVEIEDPLDTTELLNLLDEAVAAAAQREEEE